MAKSKIIKPGIYPNMPFKEYLALDLISNSYLSRLKDCPAKALVEPTETPAMILGRAIHCYILEGPERFAFEYAVSPVSDKRLKAYKEFAEEYQDKEIIVDKDFVTITGMREAVMAHPLAKKFLAGGAVEQTIIWNEQITGVRCKSRIDILPEEKRGTLIDLKSTVSAVQHAFMRDIFKRGYHRSAAFYLDAAFNGLTGKVGKNRVYDSFVDIAVEKDPPYMVNCFLMPADVIEVGRQEYISLLKKDIECKKNKFFPHWNDPEDNGGLITVELPGWMNY